MDTAGAFEAKTHLSALLERVAQGQSFTIIRYGQPVARLVSAHVSPSDRKPALRSAIEPRHRRHVVCVAFGERATQLQAVRVRAAGRLTIKLAAAGLDHLAHASTL